MTENVIIKSNPGLVDVVLNRADKGNLVSNEMALSIRDILRTLPDDIKLVRLSGLGPNFCVGRQAPQIDRSKAKATEFKAIIAAPPLDFYRSFVETRAPVLGLVQGEALGVGCALAALCDIAIAAESAVFQVPEMEHGIPPTLVLTAFAGRVGHKAAARLVLGRERISAGEALQLGIVSKVVPDDQLEKEGQFFSDRILAYPASSSQAVKEFLRCSPQIAAGALSDFAANLIANVLSSRSAHG